MMNRLRVWAVIFLTFLLILTLASPMSSQQAMFEGVDSAPDETDPIVPQDLDFPVTVSGNVLDDVGIPAPLGTVVTITTLIDTYYTTTTTDWGHYAHSDIYIVDGELIIANATFGSFSGENSETATSSVVSYIIHIGLVIYDVNNTVSGTSAQSGDPGETPVYGFEIKNTGNVRDRYLLTLTSSNGWECGIYVGDSTSALDPGESEIVSCWVTIPPGTLAGTQDILTLRATSVFDALVWEEESVTTTVNYVGNIDVLAPPSQDGLPGETLSYTFTVTNNGNYLETLDLGVWSSDPTWGPYITGESTITDLAVGGSVNVEVNHSIPSDAVPGDNAILTLTATSTVTGVFDSVSVLSSLHLPEPVTNVNGEVVSDDIIVSWTLSPSPDVDHYSIYRNTRPVFDYSAPYAVTLSTVSTFTDTNAAGDWQIYYYQVKAFNTDGLYDLNSDMVEIGEWVVPGTETKEESEKSIFTGVVVVEGTLTLDLAAFSGESITVKSEAFLTISNGALSSTSITVESGGTLEVDNTVVRVEDLYVDGALNMNYSLVSYKNLYATTGIITSVNSLLVEEP